MTPAAPIADDASQPRVDALPYEQIIALWPTLDALLGRSMLRLPNDELRQLAIEIGEGRAYVWAITEAGEIRGALVTATRDGIAVVAAASSGAIAKWPMQAITALFVHAVNHDCEMMRFIGPTFLASDLPEGFRLAEVGPGIGLFTARVGRDGNGNT